MKMHCEPSTLMKIELEDGDEFIIQVSGNSTPSPDILVKNVKGALHLTPMSMTVTEDEEIGSYDHETGVCNTHGILNCDECAQRRNDSLREKRRKVLLEKRRTSQLDAGESAELERLQAMANKELEKTFEPANKPLVEMLKSTNQEDTEIRRFEQWVTERLKSANTEAFESEVLGNFEGPKFTKTTQHSEPVENMKPVKDD